MSGWAQGIALVLLAVLLEGLVDYWVDHYKVSRRSDDDHRHSH